MNTRKITFKRGEKEIVFIGACHVGSPEYYKEISNLLNGYNPNQVIYELVKSKTKSQMSKIYLKFSQALGLISQHQGIKINENWVWGDMDAETLDFINGEPVLKKIEELKDEEIDNICTQVKNNSKFIKSLMRIGLYLYLKLGKLHPVKEVIRNYNLIIKTFEVLKSENKVCIFFGEKHLDEVANYFKSVGFVKLSIETIKVF